jgi:choloylglycine hydrolase
MLPSFILPCTTFFISNDNTKVFGRNYDFQIGKGLVIVNKKNIEKESNKDKNGNSVKWTSKFGSVTFNQYGREYPTGGMNEAGLVVELMWLDGSEYPESDSRPAVSTLQWIQYQLDNAKSVKEVIESDTKIRIGKNDVPLHYLVADKNGSTAVIEFSQGKMKYRTAEDMPFKVLTNDFYDVSVEYLAKFKEFGGSGEISNSPRSLERFAKTCKLIKEYDGKEDAVDYSFGVLKNISQPGATQWSIVYDLKNSKIYFRTLTSPEIKSVLFSELDFNCNSAVKILDVDYTKAGNVSGVMEDYTFEKNYEFLKFAFDNVNFLKDTPDEVIRKRAGYPEKFECGK